MFRIVMLVASVILSVFFNCYSAKLGTTPSRLVICGGVGMQIDVENVQTNVPFNTFVSWVGNNSYVTGENFIGSLALALISRDNEIKEILHEERDLSLSPGFGFGQVQRLCNIRVTKDISDTDIIRFITMENGNDVWLPVSSSGSESAFCKARGNTVMKSNINVDIIGVNNVPYEGYCWGTYGECLQREPIYSSTYELSIKWPEGKEHHFVKVEPFDNDIQLDPDKILFHTIQYPEYNIILMACSDDELITEQRHYNIATPGSFRDQLKDSEDRLYINNISFSGFIDETDIAFMRDEMPMLEHIDLSEADISGNILPDYAFEEKGIKSIILPKNLYGLGTNSLRKTEISKLEIPESVKYYGLNALNYCNNLALIVLHNPDVIPINWCVFEGTKREEGALFVPKGTRDAFAADSEWGKFGIIVEGDNADDWINDNDGIYKYSGVYPDVVLNEVINPDVIMNVPETVELKNKTYNVVGIGSRVFASYLIDEIYIPKSVVAIGEYAVESYNCSNLKKIEVDKDNPSYFSSEGVLYDRASSTLLTYPPAKPEKEYTIPEGIKEIGGWACYNHQLCKITLPSTLEIINSCAFCYSNLRYAANPVIISKAVNPPIIGYDAFKGGTYTNASVYVPANSLEVYRTNVDWQSFLNIYPMEEAGIEDIVGDRDAEVIIEGGSIKNKANLYIEVYNVSGGLVYKGTCSTIEVPSGLYIIKVNDKVKKIKI